MVFLNQYTYVYLRACKQYNQRRRLYNNGAYRETSNKNAIFMCDVSAIQFRRLTHV